MFCSYHNCIKSIKKWVKRPKTHSKLIKCILCELCDTVGIKAIRTLETKCNEKLNANIIMCSFIEAGNKSAKHGQLIRFFLLHKYQINNFHILNDRQLFKVD